MAIPDEAIMNFALAKAGIILIAGFSLVVYLARLAARISFSKSERVQPPARQC
jgi:hypothetical protein